MQYQKGRIRNALKFVAIFILLTGTLTAFGLLGEKWQHERIAEAKQSK